MAVAGDKIQASGATGPIVHFLYEPGTGGLDRVAILLANGMAERGIETELWLTRMDGPLSWLISDKVTVRKVPAPPFGSRGFALFAQIPALARMLRRHNPRAIFSAGNQSNLTIAIARKLSGRSRTKVIQKITNPAVRPGMTGLTAWLRMWRFQTTALAGERTLCLSAADAAICKATMPRAADRFRPVRNAYVTQAMLDRGKARAAEPNAKIVRLLSVGRLAPQKDYATLLRALARVPRNDWSINILGDGDLRQELEELASELAIGQQVHFHGFVDDPAPHFEASDTLILSSRWEGLPAVPIEAMACGCQVIATDCSPGLSQILRDCGQAVVPIGDVAGLARAIDYSISNGYDSASAREKATEYSVASSIDDHLAALAELDTSLAPVRP